VNRGVDCARELRLVGGKMGKGGWKRVGWYMGTVGIVNLVDQTTPYATAVGRNNPRETSRLVK